MKNKNAFWLSLVCGMAFTCAPMLAQSPQDSAPPPAPPNGAQLTPPPGPRTQPPPGPSLTPDQRDAQRTIPGAYRLTYTLTDMDGEKRIGAQHYQLVLDADAESASVDLRASVPVRLGSENSTQYTRQDTGLRIYAHLRQFANGMELDTNIHQTAFAEGAHGQTSPNGMPPITRQAELNTKALLTENKSVTIGELDIPGSTHRMEVQVELTRVR